MQIQSILVPVDYSECSRAALAYAAQFARDFGATLDVVHVWDRPAYVDEPVKVHLPDGGTCSLVDLIRQNAEREMAAFIQAAELDPKTKLSSRLLSGNPAATILRELEPRHHDLVIVGTHGRTGLRHALLGSVAEKIVRLAPVPVLSVRGSRP
jgi:nucleotide-binding universal stress UspA family protein